ncbi:MULTISPECIES: murein biosynthesis integral membrane protein MurJ [unclassified Streptomyces]|uniref:murein biosynthesis integral membrane protein MurJ n=1 Tax=unclassified Streptomyces TaxID=2593676 RepID=UPI0011E69C51|nr:murein biosynthesis integral membrane protein MurJ [Streptomyces sp. sk2.1]TXS68079.1 murein biosynthesis integral membrane protein MurJ [Streptomyces sp. sk2.1]
MTTTPQAPAERTEERRSGSVLRSGAVMAAGSVVSRATGFIRSAVVVAALGTGLQADGYNVANTVPNILYTLLIGGALNAVFVPELVRAARNHPDGGAAYTDRLLTACTVALLALTGLTVVGAPWIIEVYAPGYHGAQAELTVALARYCLPQILFYGLFTLLGQVLNARDRFGAMMWTPVLNNLVIIAVFGIFLGVATGSDGTLTPAQAQWLGWGTTAGIAAQTLALVPALRAAKFRWRPRFDWRGSGLTRPLRAAGWLVMLVLTNQIAYWVVTRLSTTVGQSAADQGMAGAGYTAYSYAHQLWVVPHGIVTVSLVTALMPRMSRAAADHDLAGVRRDASYALRTSAAVVVPAAALLFALAPWVTGAVYGYGRTDDADITVMAGMLMAFAPGLIAYSGQYVLSRAFYAMGDTRTPFLLNLVIAALNAGLSAAAHLLLPIRWAVTGMAGAYSVALFVGFGITAYVLRRRIPDRAAPGAPPAQARLVVAAVPAGLLGYAAARACASYGDFAALGAGTCVLLLTVALLARPLRLREIEAALAAGRRRLRRSG